MPAHARRRGLVTFLLFFFFFSFRHLFFSIATPSARRPRLTRPSRRKTTLSARRRTLSPSLAPQGGQGTWPISRHTTRDRRRGDIRGRQPSTRKQLPPRVYRKLRPALLLRKTRRPVIYTHTHAQTQTHTSARNVQRRWRIHRLLACAEYAFRTLTTFFCRGLADS